MLKATKGRHIGTTKKVVKSKQPKSQIEPDYKDIPSGCTWILIIALVFLQNF